MRRRPRVRTAPALLMLLCLTVADTAHVAELAADQEEAVRRARIALEKRGLNAARLDTKSVVEETWSDSSLGCPTKGMNYAPMISHGHVVVLVDAGRDHRVHVSGSNTVVCERPRLVSKLRTPRRARELNVVIEKARQELATRLGVSVGEIRARAVRTQDLPVHGDWCAGPQAGQELRRGYRIVFEHRGRAYSYLSDLERVRACPPIEPA